MAKSCRRFSTEFELRLVDPYLAGDGSIKGLATTAGIDHSLLLYWINKYRAGELTLDLAREESLAEAEQKVAALERKVGQLTMELELLQGRLIAVPAASNARSSIISGPAASPSSGDLVCSVSRETPTTASSQLDRQWPRWRSGRSPRPRQCGPRRPSLPTTTICARRSAPFDARMPDTHGLPCQRVHRVPH